VLFIDPAGEYSKMNSLKPRFDESWLIWESIGRTPRYPAYVEEYLPFVVSDEDTRDSSFKLQLEKIKKE